MIYVIEVAHKVPPKVTGSWAWARSQPFRSRLAKHHPTLFSFATHRPDPRKPTGLPLTLVILTAIYLAALFSGITEDILEAQRNDPKIDKHRQCGVSHMAVRAPCLRISLDYSFGKQPRRRYRGRSLRPAFYGRNVASISSFPFG